MGDIQSERSFRTIQIATHFWANSILAGDVQTAYREKAADDIFGKKMLMNPDEIFALATSYSDDKGKFARDLFRMRNLKRR